MDIDVIFGGEMADQHELPGLNGAISIEGLARSLTLVSHYAVTGKIRHRYPFSDDFSLNLVALQEGSFKARFALNLSATAVASWLRTAAISGPVGNFATDLIKTTYSSAVGLSAHADTPAVKMLLDKCPGDLDALREATVPSMKHAHSVINRGAENITINGDHNNIVVFNSRTKEFLENIDPSSLPEIKTVSVGMLNVNTRNGRVFDFELGKMVTIFVPTDRTERTLGNLGRSLSIYAKGREASQIYIKYYVRKDRSGKPERYTVVDAWFEGEAPPSE